jgi:hypothetical protein
MKPLFYLLLIAGAGAAGYFLQPTVYEMGEGMRPKKPETAVAKEKAAADAKLVTMKEAVATQNDTKALLEKMKGSISGPPPIRPPDGGVSVATTDDEIDAKFPFPKVRAIEDITQNWTAVPDRAFPRKIKTKEAVEFQLPAGKATVPVGSELVAFSFRDSKMTLGYSETNPVRATVPHTSTDFQDTMTRLYNTYVEKLKARVVTAREKAKYERDHPAPPPPPVDEQAKLAGPRPLQDNEGKIAAMLDSISAKDVTEVKASQIQQWGPVKFEMDGTKGYWTCTIVVRMSTMFGDNDSEVTAFINNGKVEKWIYAGSKEPVQ